MDIYSPPPPSPSVTISASPNPVVYYTASTLTWSSQSVSSCTASNGWSGSRSTAGNESTGNLTATKTYAIQCTGSYGPAQASVTVNVNPPSGGGGKPQCQDGVDNDNDGWKDYPADPGCASANNDRETNIPLAQCSDSADNDGDGKIDGKDPECANAYDNNETPVPDFALNKSNDIQVTIVGGIAQASNSSTITVDSQETFAGPVTLSAQGISPSIAGIAYSFGDTTLSSTEYSGGTPFSVTVPAGTQLRRVCNYTQGRQHRSRAHAHHKCESCGAEFRPAVSEFLERSQSAKLISKSEVNFQLLWKIDFRLCQRMK